MCCTVHFSVLSSWDSVDNDTSTEYGSPADMYTSPVECEFIDV